MQQLPFLVIKDFPFLFCGSNSLQAMKQMTWESDKLQKKSIESLNIARTPMPITSPFCSHKFMQEDSILYEQQFYPI